MKTALLIAWIGCQGLDLGTTAVALRAGHVETNRILRGGRLYPIKIGVNVAALFAWHKLDGANKHVLAGTVAAAGCIPGAINVRRIRSAQ